MSILGAFFALLGIATGGILIIGGIAFAYGMMRAAYDIKEEDRHDRNR